MIALLAGVARQRLFAVFLGPSGVGFLAAATRLQDVLVTTCQAGSVPGVVRAVSAGRSLGHSGPALRSLRSGSIIVITASAMVLALGLGFRRELARQLFGSPEHAWAVLAVLASIPPLALSAVLLAVLNGLQEFRMLVVHNVLVVTATLLVVAALVPSFGLPGALVALPTGALVAAGTAGVLANRATRRRLGSRLTARPGPASGRLGGLKDILTLGGVTYLDTLVGSAVALFVSVLFVNLHGLDELGYFHAAQGASRLYMGFLTTSVFSYLLPRLSGLGREELIREQNDTLGTLVWIVVVLGGVMVVLRHDVVGALYGSGFRPVEDLLRTVVVGDVLHGAVWVVGASFIPTDRLRAYALSSLASHAAFILLLCLLVPRGGAQGAALAYALGRGASLGFVWLFQWKDMRFGIGRPGLLMLATGLLLIGGLGQVPPAGRTLHALGLVALASWALLFRGALVRPPGNVAAETT